MRDRFSRLLSLGVIVYGLLCAAPAASQTHEVWVHDRPAGLLRVLDDSGQQLRTYPFSWPRAAQFIVSPDRTAIYFAWGTNGYDNQTWKLDLATGQTSFLFNNEWAVLTGYLPDSTTEFLSSGSFGQIWKYDTTTGLVSIWQNNDAGILAPFGLNVFRYELSFARNGTAIVRAGIGGGGGDALFVAQVTEVDTSHHLTNLSPLAPAARSAIDPSGRYAFYMSALEGAFGLVRHDLTSNSLAMVWQAADLYPVRTTDHDVWFMTQPPSPSNKTLHACGIVSMACRSITIVGAGVTDFQIVPVHPVDTTPPQISCTPPDAVWHAANVQVFCTASDSGAGLANADDSSFMLTTDVLDGFETADASTGVRTVCDVAGNCAQAGPFVGIRIDRQPPSISIAAPTASVYAIGQIVAASFVCADAGSGVGSCTAAVPSGAAVFTGVTGNHGIQVVAMDQAGNSTTRTVVYTVAYGVCLQYDPAKAKPRGSTMPLRIQLCDANGTNVSSSNTVVTALSVYRTSDHAPVSLEVSGNANPDFKFRLEAGTYIFNLSLNGYAPGTYVMTFRAGTDPTEHAVSFQVK